MIFESVGSWMLQETKPLLRPLLVQSIKKHNYFSKKFCYLVFLFIHIYLTTLVVAHTI
jgi:hypothetical protein